MCTKFNDGINFAGTFVAVDSGIVGAANKGNVVCNNTGNGIRYVSNGDNVLTIKGNYIGIDTSGSVAAGNGAYGIYGDGNYFTIGGSASGERNIISNNVNNGVRITSSYCVLKNNYIGTDYTGTVDMGNIGTGIWLTNCHYATIGGSGANEGNVISGNGNYAAYLTGDYNVLHGNYLGLGADGTTAIGNDFVALWITGFCSSTTVGGVNAGERNYISNNTGGGILVDGDTSYIYGNYFGTDVSGLLNRGNGDHAIFLRGGTYHYIGNNNTAARNIISGSTGSGVYVGTTATVYVLGNYIGTNVNGTGAIPNTVNGINGFSGTPTMYIGGTNSAERNIISGNTGIGVNLNNCVNCNIYNNYIGTDVNGTTDLGNGSHGISLSGASSSNINIGGNTATTRNVIAGNGGDGLNLNTTGINAIVGEYIGVDKDGNAMGNDGDGIELQTSADGLTIGGTGAGDRNIISNNGAAGIYTTGAINLVIRGNYIGVGTDGATAMGNGSDGIYLSTTSTGATVGGTTAGMGNIIADNGGDGIDIPNSSSCTVQGNYIGTNASSANLGNTGRGVFISGTSDNTMVGGMNSSATNVIAYNGQEGLAVSGAGSDFNQIRRNSMFCNSQSSGTAGISLVSSGNNSKAAPTIVTQNTTTIAGTSVANDTIELFSSDAVCSNCEGMTFVAKTTADGSGNWSFSGTFNTTYVLTATNVSGDTSPFSSCSIDLPVELVNLRADADKTAVRISWTTLSEINNDYFSVEKSIDGISFEEIGSVSGNGTSNTIMNYSFIDEEAEIGINYYRLVQYDYNGKNQIYGPVSAEFDPSRNLRIRQLNNELIFENIQSPEEVFISSIDGKKSVHQQIDVSSNRIDLSMLNPGIYIVRVTNETSSVNKKISVR